MSYARQLRDEAYQRMKGAKYRSAVVKIEGKIKRETDAAMCFEYKYSDGTTEDLWIPISQIHEIHRTYSFANGTLDSLVITEWIARKKNITSATMD